MGAFKSAVITAKGQDLLAKAVLNTADLEFTKIAVSENKLTGDLVSKTGIGTIKQDAKVASVKRTNNSSVKVSASIANNDLTNGYYVRNIGLYAKDPDEGEILYSISVADESSATADWMPPYNGVGVSSLMIDLVTVVGNADNVKVEVDPTAFATVAQIVEVNEHLTALDNTITTTTEKTLKGSVAGGLKINSIVGMTRKCTNLFDADNALKISCYLDHGATNTLVYSASSRCIYIPCEPLTTYTVSKVLSSRFCIGFSTEIPASGVLVNNYKSGNNNASLTLTSSADEKYLVVWCWHDSDTLTSTEILKTIMINEGSTALPYEPYFAGLRSVEISKINTHGKNLLVGARLADVASNYGSIIEQAKFRVTKGKTYTISADLSASTETKAYWNGLSGAFDNSTIEVKKGTFRYSKTFVAKKDIDNTLGEKNLIVMSKSATDDAVTITPSNVQLEEGTVATEFEPYTEKLITLSQPLVVEGIPVSSGGNYTDENGQQWLCNEYDFKKKQFVKRVERKVFDGTETWTRYSDGDVPYFRFKIGAGKCVVDDIVLSNIYEYNNLSVSNENIGIDVGASSVANASYIYIRPDDYSTLEAVDFANRCAELAASGTPLTVYYVLLEPIITDISDLLPIVDQIALRSLLSHDEVTHILTDSKENPHIEVEYGTNKTGAHSLTGLLTAQRNELKLMELTTAVLALNQE